MSRPQYRHQPRGEVWVHINRRGKKQTKTPWAVQYWATADRRVWRCAERVISELGSDTKNFSDDGLQPHFVVTYYLGRVRWNGKVAIVY